jgi:hypothetical protein
MKVVLVAQEAPVDMMIKIVGRVSLSGIHIG